MCRAERPWISHTVDFPASLLWIALLVWGEDRAAMLDGHTHAYTYAHTLTHAHTNAHMHTQCTHAHASIRVRRQCDMKTHTYTHTHSGEIRFALRYRLTHKQVTPKQQIVSKEQKRHWARLRQGPKTKRSFKWLTSNSSQLIWWEKCVNQAHVRNNWCSVAAVASLIACYQLQW